MLKIEITATSFLLMNALETEAHTKLLKEMHTLLLMDGELSFLSHCSLIRE